MTEKMNGHDNPTFTSDDFTYKPPNSVNGLPINGISNGIFIDHNETKGKKVEERAVWSNKLEFLMSCIALSVLSNLTLICVQSD